jgi:hypothetical protein
MKYLLFIFWVACADPFPFDRHNLQDFRILEADVHNGYADAVIWSGIGPFHHQSPILHWSVDGEVVAEGFDVEVPFAEQYELKVESPGGEILWADVIPGDSLVAPEVSRLVWTEAEEQEYSIDERLHVEIEESGVLSSEKVARLKVSEEANTEDVQFRWSADGGTILELSTVSTDVFFDTLTFEENELLSREDGEHTRIHVFLLCIDGMGGSSHRWIDLDFSGESTKFFQKEMIVSFEGDAEPGFVQVDFVQTVDGFSLENPVSIDTPSDDIPHPCMKSSLFDLAWLRQGRCTTEDLDGLSLVLEVQ